MVSDVVARLLCLRQTRRLGAAAPLFLLSLSLIAGSRAVVRASAASSLDFEPAGKQMVANLDSYAGAYWARVAGRDTNLPPHTNGHDEFAARWTREALANLHGLPVTVYHQPFATPGFHGQPATGPGMNVILVVPGSRHPDEAIVIGTHYDGEPFSKGSAYDDTSGSMILLALAQELGTLWRAQGLPDRTVEFVLFDAEEQGLIGSAAYTFAERQGAIMPRPVMMIDEEQSGAGYPVRPFGLIDRGLTPSYAITTNAPPKGFGKLFGVATPPKQADLKLMVRRLTAIRTSVFADLHTAYPSLDYRGGDAPAFTAGEEKQLKIGPYPLCCSDNLPFELLGLPTVTFSGNGSYYQHQRDSFQFPFDQPQDTPQALACDTGGSPHPSLALEAALDLPLDLSYQLVSLYAPPASGQGVTVITSVPGAGARLVFRAVKAATAQWDFGDGSRASGGNVSHTYAHAGTYQLTVHADNAVRTWTLHVPAHQPVFQSKIHDLRPPPIIPWHPEELAGVPGCH